MFFFDEDDKNYILDPFRLLHFKLSKQIYEKLYDYQLVALSWMWDLFRKQQGGILGDDMGLGKTVQVSSFLGGLFSGRLISYVLMIVPLSLTHQWIKELSIWAKGVKTKLYHGNKAQRERELCYFQNSPGVMVTTYGTALKDAAKLANVNWDYVILDEGHKVKNPKNKLRKTIATIQSKRKILLTGTPIMNNLQEFWALFDYVCNGTLLGSLRTFIAEFDKPISAGNDREASATEKNRGAAVAQKLRNIVAPHFLRRTKAEVLKADTPQKNIKKGEFSKSPIEKRSLKLKAQKNDFVVWIYLSPAQLTLYNKFLGTESVKQVLNKTRSPLAALSILKKICDHPQLLRDEMQDCHDLHIRKSLENTNIVEQSGKLTFLMNLLQNLKSEGHRPLIFSQSTKVLDIIQELLDEQKYTYMRVDGTINKMDERQSRIDTFNTKTSYFCFLLTTQVGGVGLNLTGADRVIIFDPSWNNMDDQVVDRAYRIGQTRNVIIYRLITCGTIEEKMYRKQVFKGALSRCMTQKDQSHHRYFTSTELSELFTLDDPQTSETQKMLQKLHSHKRKKRPSLDEHSEWLATLNIFGISDHDLLYSEENETISKDLSKQFFQEPLGVASKKRKRNTNTKSSQSTLIDLSQNDNSSDESDVSGDDVVVMPKKRKSSPDESDDLIQISSDDDFVPDKTPPPKKSQLNRNKPLPKTTYEPTEDIDSESDQDDMETKSQFVNDDIESASEEILVQTQKSTNSKKTDSDIESDSQEILVQTKKSTNNKKIDSDIETDSQEILVQTQKSKKVKDVDESIDDIEEIETDQIFTKNKQTFQFKKDSPDNDEIESDSDSPISLFKSSTQKPNISQQVEKKTPSDNGMVEQNVPIRKIIKETPLKGKDFDASCSEDSTIDEGSVNQKKMTFPTQPPKSQPLISQPKITFPKISQPQISFPQNKPPQNPLQNQKSFVFKQQIGNTEKASTKPTQQKVSSKPFIPVQRDNPFEIKNSKFIDLT
uniref:DNA excision repair protein ERCC-6-like n=1 Tax=Arcella intermedia TaxID=1963864 RepID=A0A6B2KWX3_9EUKA